MALAACTPVKNRPGKRKTIEVTFDGFILLVQIETLLGAGLNDIAASATNGRLLIIGMDALLHVVSPLSGYALQS